VKQEAPSTTEAAIASNTVPISTPTPPMASPTATSLPVSATATPQTLDAYLESYCGPELIYSASWLESIGYPRAHEGEGEPALHLICSQNERYYFQVSGFAPGEWVIPETGILVRAPIGEYFSLEVAHGVGHEGAFVASVKFNGIEPAGEWDLRLIGTEGSDASTKFNYMPAEPDLIIIKVETAQNGDTLYTFLATGWTPGEVLYVAGEAPYGTGPREEIGAVGEMGYAEPLQIPFPVSAPDGEYSITVSGTSNEVTILLTCQAGAYEPQPSSSDLADLVYDQATQSYQAGLYRQAVEDYTHAIELDPMHKSALNMAAWTLLFHLDTDYQMAMDYAQRSVAVDPDRHNIDTLALAYFKLGDYEASILYYNIALFFDDELAGSYRGRGDVYLAMGDFDAAITDYVSFLSLEPAAPDREAIEAIIESISDN
jgi:tetratricopeptide (TPR) repeat protein